MGLRSPQEMKRVDIRPESSTRFEGTRPAQLDKTFISTASKGLSAMEEANKKMYEEQLRQVQAAEENAGDEIVIRANAELAQVDGMNASEKAITIRERVKKELADRSNKVAPQFRPYVEQVYAKKLTRYNKFAIPYTLGQIKKVQDDNIKTFIRNRIDEAAEESANPDEFSMTLAELKLAAKQRAIRQYGDLPETQDMIADAVGTVSSTAILKGIQQQAALGRIDNANAIMDKYDFELTPNDRLKALKFLKEKTEESEAYNAKALAERAFEIEDPMQQEKFLLYGTETQEGFMKAKAVLNSMRASKKKSEDLHDSKIYDSIYKDIEAGIPLDMAKVYSMKDPDKRNKVIDDFNRFGGTANRVTDPKEKSFLAEMMFSDSEAFKNYSLSRSKIKLSPADFSYFEKKQLSLKEADAKREQDLLFSSGKEFKDIRNEAVNNALRNELVAPERKAELQIAADDLLDRLVRNSKGLTSRDVRRIYQDKLNEFISNGMKVEVEEPKKWSNIWGLAPWSKEDVHSRYIPMFDHTEEEIEKAQKMAPGLGVEEALRILDRVKNRQRGMK